ncbi:MAG: NAD(P)-dependent oxidoreductase [Bacteroidaceae bacterium]|nr:NAD(P)-dependent oxidoreductase [Bacteroidaceae bacterium]MBR5891715.1 NAD(P)-dependent oxidoreductase [Bacteroidaceae bacterium]
MKCYLVTGGAGFFGSIMKRILLNGGHRVVSIDLQSDDLVYDNFIAYKGDINDDSLMTRIFEEYEFDAIYHFAALLAHVKSELKNLWRANVDGTANVAKYAAKYGVQRVVFTSSNCLWAEDFLHKITEDEVPCPIEIYGKSKLEGEKILLSHDEFVSIIFRCPTIMDEGRLGLLGILYQFIDEGRRLPMVGKGDNLYQFIYAKDLANACLLARDYNRSEVFNIGSDDVKDFRTVYRYVIEKAGSKSKLMFLPKGLMIAGMKICFALGISPLGPYQYKMIASNFVFDTTKIKRELGWMPTKTNEEMLLTAYNYYHNNREEILSRKDVSAHSSVAKMGIIRVIKWFC